MFDFHDLPLIKTNLCKFEENLIKVWGAPAAPESLEIMNFNEVHYFGGVEAGRG